jgi:hypothetical protein
MLRRLPRGASRHFPPDELSIVLSGLESTVEEVEEVMTNGANQEERILRVLQSVLPGWVPAPEPARISLQYSRAVFCLRRKGFVIANRVEVVDGVRHGFVRLAGPAIAPRQEGRSAEPGRADKARECIARALAEPKEPVSTSLFGDLAPERHRDDG